MIYVILEADLAAVEIKIIYISTGLYSDNVFGTTVIYKIIISLSFGKNMYKRALCI